MAGPLAAAFGTAAVLTAGGALIVVLPVLLIAVLPEIRRLGAPAPSQPPEPAGARREPPQQPAVSG